MNETTFTKKLTRKQELFCKKYVELKGNGTQAYMAVYGVAENVAAVKASEAVRNGKIIAELKRLTADTDAEELDRRTRILNELDTAAFSKPELLYGPKWNEKIKALEIVAKIEGMMVDKVDMKGDMTFKLVRGDDDTD